MAHTRTVITLLLGAVTALALALGIASVTSSVAAAGEPTNRGWITPIGQDFEE